LILLTFRCAQLLIIFQIGPEYIPIAFETAAMFDPTVKLYYNDYNIETAGAKATSAQNLVKSLKSRGIKIDGVGLQAHFIVGETASQASLASNLQAFTALGVEVAYTELDIRFSSLPPTTAGFAQQSTDYVNTVGACLATTNCVGITIWDYTDKYSWIPSTFPGQGDACLWNSDFTTKPAYTAVLSLLGGSATGMPTPTTLKTSTVASATPTPVTGGGTIPVWDQCGGETWVGSGTCKF
jgi:endo-1,4-beta-xylanase